MIEFVCKLKDFWSHDLKTHSYSRQVAYDSMKNGDHWHQNFKQGFLQQSLGDDLPACRDRFVHDLDLDPDVSTVSWIGLVPGQFIAPHVDLFIQLRERTGALIDQCHRHLVFLEEWQFGQTVEFESITIRKWCAGDTWKFDHTEQHWAANASNHDFHTCQVNTVKIVDY